jgi:leucyl/phenylalanyl-tRNA--protein transferase
MLLSAYKRGIFPWFSEGDPILWWSPDPRFVLFPESLHVSGTMRKVMRRYLKREGFELALDRDFPSIIRACSSAPRTGQDGTWITEGMIEGYIELHRLGYAHSVELYSGGELLGGLYGVSLGSAFFGESMFSRGPDASKSALIPFVWMLGEEGFSLIDSQVRTGHVASIGGREIAREEYLVLLATCLRNPTRKGDWGSIFPRFPESEAWRAFLGTA